MKIAASALATLLGTVDVPFVFITRLQTATVYRPQLTGFTFMADGIPTFEQVWFNK